MKYLTEYKIALFHTSWRTIQVLSITLIKLEFDTFYYTLSFLIPKGIYIWQIFCKKVEKVTDLKYYLDRTIYIIPTYFDIL